MEQCAPMSLGAGGALGLCRAFTHGLTRHATRTGRDHMLGCRQGSAARAAVAQAHNPEAHASGLADGMAESEQIDLWRVGGRCCVSMCSSVLYYQLDFSLYVVAGR